MEDAVCYLLVERRYNRSSNERAGNVDMGLGNE